MPSGSYVPSGNEYIEQFSTAHSGIARNFSVNKKKCKNPEHYTDFLLYNALSDAQTGMGITFVLAQYDEQGVPLLIMGYITLKASSLLQDTGEGYTGRPGIEISELAVDARFEGRGIGSALLDYAMYCCREIQNKAGVMYLLVYADRHAVGFYEHVLGFAETRDIYEIPNETWNASCIPMYLKISPEVLIEPCYISDDDDDESDDWF